MLGNEAVARGAVEAGVNFVTGYPGTPSSEIVESIIPVAEDHDIYVEWSVNEKVAFEASYAAAITGLRSMVTMKHVGLNVAADALSVAFESGVKGGMVLAVSDDPGAPVSQNEQDSRNYALHAHIPCFEPSDPQEAKDMTIKAFELSELLEQIILLRLTAGVSHMFGNVELGPIIATHRKARFPHKEWPRFYVESSWIVTSEHERAHMLLEKAEKEYYKMPFNKLDLSGKEKVGVVASGAVYNISKEAVRMLNFQDEVAFLKVGTSYPLPRKLVEHFINALSTILVLEENEPFIENHVKIIASEIGCKATIKGRRSGDVPWSDALTLYKVLPIIQKLVGKEYKELFRERNQIIESILKQVPSRGFNICPGCPHLGSLTALRRVMRRRTGKTSFEESGFIMLADIGCYGMGGYPPFEIQETTFSMGGSIGSANGFSRAKTGEIVIASIGDSTFFHAGIPALINAVWHGTKMTVIIHDNSIVAMTGEQPCPDTGWTATGKLAPIIRPENICRGIGVEFIEIVDPYDLKAMEQTIERAIDYEGVSVVVAKRECALLAARKARRMGLKQEKKVHIDQQKCIGKECGCARYCTRIFNCPAIVWDFEASKAKIYEVLCTNCGLCSYVCPANAIVVEEASR